jgi:hypothetical protein
MGAESGAGVCATAVPTIAERTAAANARLCDFVEFIRGSPLFFKSPQSPGG